MPRPRVAVIFRTHFWDDFAFRAATRLWDRSEGLDFYVEVNETECGPVDVGPFRKISHSVAYFESLGLPCVAGHGAAPLWWNCDYGLYGAALTLPDYDYYFLLEYDVLANIALRSLVDRVADAGIECVTSFDAYPLREPWGYTPSCVDLPYARKVWTPLCIMLTTRGAALHLLSERQCLADRYAAGRMSAWPISEGFFASALMSAGFATGSLTRLVRLANFGTEAVYLETDPAAREGDFSHAVLSPARFWSKFVDRGLAVMLGARQYDRLRQARESLRRIAWTEFGDWRIAAEEGNLALDRPAWQSSCSAWSRKSKPPGADPVAVDARGANCGVITGGFCFHTEYEEAPWWQVDLERLCAVEEVRVYNPLRRPERARRLSVQTSGDGECWEEVYRKMDDSIFAGKDSPLVCRFFPPVPARYLRVMLTQPGSLHLDEIEVFGTPFTGIPRVIG